MSSRRRGRLGSALAAVGALWLLLAGLASTPALADGTETLGPPSIPIATGSGFVAAGVGLSDRAAGQPGTISINVPGAVVQALLYWEGANLQATVLAPTMDITVNSFPVTGDFIGGDTFYSGADGGWVTVSYRADITPLVGPGANSLVIDGLDFTQVNDGAGALVIYDDGSSSEIDIRDGNDYAFLTGVFTGPQSMTVPQTFSFAPSTVDRTARLSLFFAAVSGGASTGGILRPSTIEITVAGVTTELINVLSSGDGEEWDTVNVVDVSIPAGATSLTVQAFSDDRLNTGYLPASFVWVGAGLSLAPGVGSLGDCVWEDLNENGIQDLLFPPFEPGIPDVKLNLTSDCDPGFFRTTRTGPGPICGEGFYAFTDLDLDCKYTVTVDPCNFDNAPDATCADGGPAGALVGLAETAVGQGDGCNDSDGSMAMTVLTPEMPNDPCLDFGYSVPVCQVEIDKTCCIPPSVLPGGLECEAKIAATTLRYIGPDDPDADVVFSGKAEGDASYLGVDLISGVTVLADPGQNGFTVDGRPGDLGSKLTVTIDGVAEVIHTSCSAPYIVGQPAPLDGQTGPGVEKGDPSPNWLVERFVDKEGRESSLPDPDPSGETACRPIGGTTGDDCQGKVIKAVFEYTGADCEVPLGNPQGGKAKCEGSPGGAATAKVMLQKASAKIIIDPSLVGLGEKVSIRGQDGKELESNTKLEVVGSGTQKLEIHTSCSKALNVGDEFGSLKLVELTTTKGGTVTDDVTPVEFLEMCELAADSDDDSDSDSDSDNGLVSIGRTVEYQYTVSSPLSNTGPITVSVEDDPDVDDGDPTTIEIGSGITLDPGEEVTLFATRTLSATTTNQATATATTNGQQCQAMDEVTVEIIPPPLEAFNCKDAKPITSLTLIWDGPNGTKVTVESGEQFFVDNGQKVSFGVAGLGNDVDVDMAGVGSSRFHVSCSDPEMNGPEDCGQPQGNGKDNKSGLDLWTFAGMAGAQALVCP